MSTGAKAENQAGPPSGEASGPVKDYTTRDECAPKSSGGSGASVDATMPESDGSGGKK